jgi:chromate transport protein ChrA
MDMPTILIGLATLAFLLVPKKIPEPVLILAAGLVGLLLKGAV